MADSTVKLIAPTELLQEAYLDFVADFHAAGEELLDGAGGMGWEGFSGFVRRSVVLTLFETKTETQRSLCTS